MLGAVGVIHGEDVGAGDRDVAAQDPPRLLEEHGVVAVPLPEEELAPDEALPRPDVERVGQVVEAAHEAAAAQLVHVEDGVVVHEDVRDPPGGADGVGHGKILGGRAGRRQRQEHGQGSHKPRTGAVVGGGGWVARRDGDLLDALLGNEAV